MFFTFYAEIQVWDKLGMALSIYLVVQKIQALAKPAWLIPSPLIYKNVIVLISSP